MLLALTPPGPGAQQGWRTGPFLLARRPRQEDVDGLLSAGWCAGAMEFGLTLPQGAQRDLRPDVLTVARQAEVAGFAGLWAYERRLWPLHPADGCYGIDGLAWDEYYQYCAEPLTVLTLAAAVTTRIRLGTSVLIAPLHDKLQLARTLATLDQATGGGRLTAGLGGGWSADEYAASGADFARRGRAFDEMIDGLRALGGPDPVTYADRQIVIREALVNPKPLRQIPILLGGGFSPRALRRIAEKSDGWLPVNTPGAVIAETWKQILDLAQAAGRDPGQLRLTPAAPFIVVTAQPLGADRPLFHGSVAQLMDDFAAIAAAGADELVIGLDSSSATASELIDRALMLLDAARTAGLTG
jgi:probable F420-dependent oxidoreductase